MYVGRYIYICIYICMHVWIYIYIYVCMHVCMYKHVFFPLICVKKLLGSDCRFGFDIKYCMYNQPDMLRIQKLVIEDRQEHLCRTM